MKWWIGLGLIYAAIELATIGWGIPGPGRLFTYQMDEWHSVMAVRSVFTKGTNNITGSAAGMMGYFISSGVWLVPFVVTKVIDPGVIKSVVDGLDQQQKLLIVLRLSTIGWGLLAMAGAALTLREMGVEEKAGKGAIGWWIVAPIWLTLSNYFKYDMAVVAMIWICLWRMMKYLSRPSRRNLAWAGAAAGFGIALKLAGLPLLGIVAWGWWRGEGRKGWDAVAAAAAFAVIVAGLGMPDVILGKGNWFGQVNDLTRNLPQQVNNLKLGVNFVAFWLAREFPALFGHLGWIVGLGGLVVAMGKVMAGNKKVELAIVGLAGFWASIMTLGMGGGGNRATVLIPGLVILGAIGLEKIKPGWRVWVIVIGMAVQLGEAGGWLAVKASPDPRQTSTVWMESHIEEGKTIGVENIPIYQKLPDKITYEFYKQTYDKTFRGKWKYEVIDAKSAELPGTVVVSDGKFEEKYWIRTPKKDLLARLKAEGYKLTAEFEPVYKDMFMFNITNLVPAPTSIEIYQK